MALTSDETLENVFFFQKAFYGGVLDRTLEKELAQLTDEQRRAEMFEYIAWAHEELCEVRRELKYKLWDTGAPDWAKVRTEICDVLLLGLDLAMLAGMDDTEKLAARLRSKQKRNFERLGAANG